MRVKGPLPEICFPLFFLPGPPTWGGGGGGQKTPLKGNPPPIFAYLLFTFAPIAALSDASASPVPKSSKKLELIDPDVKGERMVIRVDFNGPLI